VLQVQGWARVGPGWAYMPMLRRLCCVSCRVANLQETNVRICFSRMTLRPKTLGIAKCSGSCLKCEVLSYVSPSMRRGREREGGGRGGSSCNLHTRPLPHHCTIPRVSSKQHHQKPKTNGLRATRTAMPMQIGHGHGGVSAYRRLLGEVKSTSYEVRRPRALRHI
jgi:hypothetical protein